MSRLVTLFGGGGFLGRYVAQELLRAGVRVRVAERDPSDAWYLKPLGELGQTQFVAASVTSPATVAHAVRGADAVVNLVGVLKGDFDAIHRKGAANVAAAAKAAGVGALVHISAIGADPQSASGYGRSKGEGEAAVRTAFPGATIIRPSIVFGPEDAFINRFARLATIAPMVPVIGGAAKFQPVYVVDLARAIASAAVDPGTHAGKTYEIGGPEVVTMRELNARIAAWTDHKRPLTNVPDIVAEAISRFGFLPGAPLTRDQWLMLQQDNVVAADAEGLEAFGIEPTPMAAVAPDWLVRYRRHGRFAKQRAA